MMDLARTQDGQVDLVELAREISRREGGAVNLPMPQIQEVLSCLGEVLAGAGLVPAAEVMSRLMERGAARLETDAALASMGKECACGARHGLEVFPGAFGQPVVLCADCRGRPRKG